MKGRILIILLLGFICCGKSAYGQLVVNEFSQGSSGGNKEYIELVVVGTRTCTDSTADLRGWIVDDQNGWFTAAATIAQGHFRFPNITNWSKVPYGSVILLYNNEDKNASISLSDDPTDANKDLVYVVPTNSNIYIEEFVSAPVSPSSTTYTYPATATAYIATTVSSWVNRIAMTNNGDVISIVKPSNLASAYFSVMFGLTATAGFHTPSVVLGNVAGGQNAYLTDSYFANVAGWSIGVAGTNETPGSGNGGANTTWINSMRVSAATFASFSFTPTSQCVNKPFSFTNLSAVSSCADRYSALWNFTTTAATVSGLGAPNVTAANQTGVGTGVTIALVGGTRQLTPNPAPWPTTRGAADNHYIEYSVSPVAGKTLTVDTVTWRDSHANSSGNTVVSIEYAINAGSFISLGTSSITTINTTPGAAFHTIAISPINAGIGETIKIRMYIYNGNGRTVYVDDFTVKGSTNSYSSTATYSWDFGDGTATSLAISPTHTYTTGGTYSVKLTASNDCSCTDDTTISVTVVALPIPTFTINSQTQCLAGNSFTLTNTTVGTNTYAWNFGDGTTSTATTPPAHVYSISGSYTIKLVATNSTGCKDSTTTTITVNASPVVDFTINTDPQCLVGNSFTFTNTSIINSCTNGLVAAWPLTANTTPTVTGAGAASVTASNMTVGGNLSISSYNGSQGVRLTSGVNWPTVYTVGYHVDFPISPTTANNFTINSYSFTSQISGGSASGSTVYQIAYILNGGPPILVGSPLSIATADGTITFKNTSAIPVSSGQTLVVRLYIYASGSTVSSSRRVDIKDFTLNATTSSSSGTYAWNFGDGTTSTATNGISPKTYASGGAYVVTLITTNGCGCSDSAKHTVTVTPTPSAPLASSPQSFCSSANATIASLVATGTGLLWYAASTGGTALASSTALVNGTTYYVSQTASSCESARTPVTGTINPNVVPSVSVTPAPTVTSCTGSPITFTATPVNGGAAPTYQWLINGGLVSGATGSTFTISSLIDNDVVSVVMTSNATCTTTSTASSNNVTVTITTAAASAVNITPTTVSSCTGLPITFTASPVNGGPGPTYQWSVNNGPIVGETASTFTSSTLNNNDVVTVVMTSNAVCRSTSNATSNLVTVTINPVPTTPVLSVSDTCGSSKITASNFAGTLTWSDGGTGNPRTVTTPATLTVTQTLNGCISATSSAVTAAPSAFPIAPTVSVTTQPSCTVAKGTITVTAPAGAGITYSIDGITYTNNTGIFTNVASGTYNVTVKNGSGCTSPAVSVTVDPQPPTPVAPVATITQPTCTVATGTISITSPTGVGLTYSIDGTNYTNNSGVFTDLAPGPYNVTAKNSSGCISAITPITINAQPATPVAPSVISTQPTCTIATGTIAITSPTGPGITYSIDGIDYSNTSGTFTNVAPALYNVTVKNSSGCVSSSTPVTIITQPATPAAPTVTTTQPTCAVATGSINVSAPTGTGLVYSIDGVDYSNATGIFNNVAPNTYNVTVRNSSGCTSTATQVTIDPQPATPVAPTVSLTQPTCTVATGTITVTAPTSAGLTFSIDELDYSNTSGVFNNVIPNSYNVTVRNGSGCVSPVTIVTINTPPGTPIAPIVTSTQPTCTISTGTITVTSPTGTGFTYSIDGTNYSNATGVFNNVLPNNYNVTVRNANGCTSTATAATINAQPITPAAPVLVPTQPTCTVATGTITVTSPTGAGLTYSIDGADYSNSNGVFNNVVANSYNITVKNSSGCISPATSVTINAQPTTPVAPTVTPTQPTCTVATGAITITSPTGAGLTFSIDGTNYTNTTGSFTRLAPNTYSVTVKNGSGCISPATSVTINAAPTTPVAPTVTPTQPTCTVAIGTITITSPTGAGFTFSIDGTNYTNTTGSFTGLVPNTYTVTVKNIDGCISPATTVTINAQPSSPAAPTVTTTQPTCSDATGTIAITSPIGAGLTYSIDGVSYTNTTGVFNNLTPNTYNVSAKNISGCTSPSVVVIINSQPATPAAPAITLIQPACTIATGSITITSPTGAGLSYSIDGVDYSNTSGIFNNLAPNSYTLTVKNSSGCVSPSITIVINAQPATPSAPVVTPTQPTCTVATGTITVSSPTGAGFTFSIDGVTYTNTTGTFTGLTPNTYNVTVKNGSGCISSSTPVTINAQPVTPAAPTITLTQPTCAVATGTITITSPTGAGLTYSIDGATYVNTSGIFTGLAANTYSVTSKNSNGCISSSTPITINAQPTTPAAPTINLTQPTCSIATGTITVTSPTGAGFTYSVDGTTYGNTSGSFPGLAPNTYNVTIKSSSGCISSSTSVTINNPPALLTPDVNITPAAVTLCSGSNVTFTAAPTNGGSAPTYQWLLNGVAISGQTGSTFSSSSLINNDAVSVVMTSNEPCASPLTDTSNVVAVTITSAAAPTISITPTTVSVCSGSNVTFTASAVNGGNAPTYQWYVNSNLIAGQTSSTFTTSTLNNGDQVNVVLTSNATCATVPTASSNIVAVVITSPVTPSVSITPTAPSACSGTAITFTASPTNGGTPTYQWFINNNPVAGQTGSTFTSSTLNNNDVVKVIMTSNAACAITATVTSNLATVTITPVVTPSVTITPSTVTVCSGSPVTFIAVPVNGGTAPTYQWFLNGNVVNGQTSSTFTTSSLNNGDVVAVTLTSNAACATTFNATSNSVTVAITSAGAPLVSITPTSVSVCSGSNISFIAAAVNGGSAPTYQWYLNGNIIAGQTASTLTSSTLVNGDKVTVMMTSNASCATVPTATSNIVTVTITPLVTPSVSITPTTPSACSGSSITFTAAPTNGGTPTYQWFINNNLVVGQTASTFSSSTLNNNDVVKVIMTSNVACATTPTATSNPVTVTITPLVTPSVTITPANVTTCSGSAITFTALPVNGGAVPGYQWFLNGNPVSGQTGSTFTSSSFVNSDVIALVMTSSAACPTTPTANSNSATITITSAGAPSVSITPTIVSICGGSPVTFTASPVNGGSAPTYQWLLNGNPVSGQTAASFTSSSLNNNDAVSVIITSNASCATSPTANSNSVVVTITPSVTPSVSITPTNASACAGKPITFTAVPVNGGAPTYQWFVNGNPVIGQTGTTFTSSTLTNGNQVTVVMTSNASCATSSTATSNVVIVTIPNFTPVVKDSVVKGCSSVVFNNTTYTSSTVIRDTVRSLLGCDSIYKVTTITVQTVTPVQKDTAKTGCGNVIFNGITYNVSTIVRDTIRTLIGCDSIYKVATISVQNITPVGDTANYSGCTSYTFNGITYNAATLIRDTVRSVFSCDSLYHVTRITIAAPAVVLNASASGCTSVFFLGTTYTSSAVVKDTLKTSTGCDSIYRTTTITIGQPAEVVTTNVYGCNSVTYQTGTYTSSTILKDTLKGLQGCDSVYKTINILVRKLTPLVRNDTLNGCSSVVYNGTTYTASTILKDTVRSASPYGCDSIYNNHHINIKNITLVVKSDTINACNTVSYNGIAYSASTILRDTVKSTALASCDSIYNVHYIFIKAITPITRHDTISGCNGVTYNGTIYTSSTIIKDTLRTAAPFTCDSVYNQHHILVQPITPVIQPLVYTGCGSVVLNGVTYTTPVLLRDTIRTAAGCDSIYKLTAIIVQNITPRRDSVNLFGCVSYLLNGTTYNASSILRDTVRSIIGCDSIYKVTSINIAGAATNVNVVASGCTSVTFLGVTYTSSVVVKDTLKNFAGCDSIYRTTTITIGQPATLVTVNLSGCNSLIYQGTTYTTSTILKDTLQGVQGCDSVYRTTNIVIQNRTPLVKSDTITGCNSLIYKGNVYNASAVLKDTIRSSSPFNCDSVYNVHYINIKNIIAVTKTDTVRGCKSVVFNGTLYTSSVVLRDTIRSSSPYNCDSIYGEHYIIIQNVTPTTQSSFFNGCGRVVVNGTTYLNSATLRDTLRTTAGCDSIYKVIIITVQTLTPTRDTANYFGCKSYTFNNVTYTASTMLADTLRSIFGCDSIYHLTKIAIASSAITVNNTLSGCTSVTFNSLTYTTSVIIKDTLKTSLGCDSIYRTTIINVGQAAQRDTTLMKGCNSVSFNGITYTASTILYDTLVGVQGCDSVYRVRKITVQNLIVGRDTANYFGCKSVTLNGVAYTSSTFASDTLISSLGCDSIYRVARITIAPLATSISNNLVACKSITFNGTIYTASTVVRDTLKTILGCDSIYRSTNIVIQNLTPVIQSIIVSGCNSITFNGIVYASATLVRDTLKSALGCDSVYKITTINVQVVNPETIVSQLFGCTSVVFNGTTYTTLGIIKDTIRTAIGCDSIFHQTFINISPQPVRDTTLIGGCNSIIFNGVTYSTSTILRDTLRTARGCDSVFHVTRIVIPNIVPAIQLETLFDCNSYTYQGTTYLSAVALKDTVRSVGGCDSIYRTVNINIQTIAPTTRNINVSGCNSLIFLGITYTSSTIVRDTLRTTLGCDSLYQVANIIIQKITPVVETTSITACNATTFQGITYTSSTVVRDTSRSRLGCDSIFRVVNLNIQVITPVTQNNTLSGCNSLVYLGNTYTSSTTLKDTLRSTFGCDSVYRNTSINIQKIDPVAQVTTLYGCRSASYLGLTYTASITVRDTIRTTLGCDSIYKIANITIAPPPVINNNTVSGCRQVVHNNVTYTSSVMLKDTLRNIAGCDSVYNNTNVIIEKFKINITAAPNPVLQGDIVNLTTASAVAYNVIAWTPISLFNNQTATRQNFTADSSISIALVGRSASGCLDTAKVDVVVNMVDDLFVPNVFTPNNDGNNDVFKAYSSSFRTVEIKVFNQYGEMVYQANNNNGWDGTYKGKHQPVAVYSYNVTGTYRNGKTFSVKGLINLIR